MLCQIEVSPVGDTLDFGPAYGELVFDVEAAFGIMRQFLVIVFAQPEVFFPDAHANIIVEPLVHPVIEPLHIGAGLDEILDLHLLKFAGAEDEVSRGNLVTERFTHLSDSERQFFARGSLNVEKVDELRLRCLRAQIDRVGLILHRPHMRFKQQVEHAGLGQLPSTIRTGG